MNLKEYLNQIHDDKEKLSALKAAAEAGKDKEFLAAEGVEVSRELSDDALSAVAGGDDGSLTDCTSLGSGDSYTTTVYQTDSRGNPTHWKRVNNSAGTYEIYCYKCKKCGRVLHQGTLNLYYCDPCDDWFWGPDKTILQRG